MTHNLILASKSPIRAKLLDNAGIKFKVIKPKTDEKEIKINAKKQKLSIKEFAGFIANEKSLSVSRKKKELYIIAADQTLIFQGQIYDKPQSEEQAKNRLWKMKNHKHTLITATVVANNNNIIWESCEYADIYLRDFDREFLDKYAKNAKQDLCSTAGAAAIEGLGIQLIDKIIGDYFTVLGINLIPLLCCLRKHNLAL